MMKPEMLKGESGNPFSMLDARSSQRKVLLYLGRIHPKKGLVNLLRAWSKVQSGKGSALGSSPSALSAPEWVLAIAGWDQGGHEAELKRLCDELGIKWSDVREHREPNSISAFSFQDFSICFLGPLFGRDKESAYANCDAFILPSYSEGLPMVVLEAWAYGKPVLMTPECNLPEGFAANAALRIEQSAAGRGQRAEDRRSIEDGLRQLLAARDSELAALGANGRALVAEKFTWPKIAADMLSVYRWVVGGGSPPDCIQLK
jgi:poly(glycerol-phosphate) alpha-glucosyltransferase